MRDFLFLFLHLIVIVVRLAKPGGLRSVLAESLLLRHQLLILNRGRKRAPNPRPSDRMIAGLCALFMKRVRLLRAAVVLKPSTLLHLHKVLRKRKYRLLFSSPRGSRPGPKGPAKELIAAVVEMKRRNPHWGCPRIAQQIALAFGVAIDKDVVRRILSAHYHPPSDTDPSWLTFRLGRRTRPAGLAGSSLPAHHLFNPGRDGTGVDNDQYQLGFGGAGHTGTAGTKPFRFGIWTFGRLLASMTSLSWMMPLRKSR